MKSRICRFVEEIDKEREIKTMEKNLELYNKVRQVPESAQKPIRGGRLKGMTDINPMWRIKTLTDLFGPCGIGWYYEVKDRWIETSMSNDEITANVLISLYIKHDGAWSAPIQGIGGSKLVANEKQGLYVNDECFKMALTDAISVACKALGVGADIYWSNDNTKYNDTKKENFEQEMESERTKLIDKGKQKVLLQMAESCGVSLETILQNYGIKSLDEMTAEMYGNALNRLNATGKK